MNAIPIPITAVFIGIFAVMLVGISIRVTVHRAKKKISFFDGGDKELGAAMRVQGNFIEYVPMALAVMGLIEWMGAQHWVVYLFGILLLVARLAHAWGLYANVFKARVAGTSASWLLLVAGGLFVIGRVA